MIIGRLRHRLILKSPTQTQGTTGEITVTFTTSETVWGSMTPLSGRELEAAKQISEEITYQAVIRYKSTITTEWTIEHKSRTFEIVNIQDFEEREKYQTLLLKEIK